MCKFSKPVDARVEHPRPGPRSQIPLSVIHRALHAGPTRRSQARRTVSARPSLLPILAIIRMERQRPVARGTEVVMIEPDQFLIIIGSAKCGTTSLFDYLGQHPKICGSVPKELEFFTEHQYLGWPHPRDRPGVRRYEDFWPDFDPEIHRYALEGSTGYTKWPEEVGVAERMREYGIRPRLIYLVRDPIERIESHYNYIRVMNRRSGPALDDPYMVDLSRYATQINPFLRTYGREAIRVVDFANLRADPNQVCAELYEWLGLERHTLLEPGISNETARMKSSQLSRVVTLRRAALHLPRPVRKFGKTIALRLFPYNHQRVRLSVDHAEEIRALLNDDMRKLACDWDIDIVSWGFDRVV